MLSNFSSSLEDLSYPHVSQKDFIQDDIDGKSAGRWTSEEHTLFLQGLKMYNKQWKMIAELVKTRTVVQIRTHAQKYFQKLEKGKVLNSLSTSSGDEMPLSPCSKAGSRADSITSADGYDILLGFANNDCETETERCFHPDDYSSNQAATVLKKRKSESRKRSRTAMSEDRRHPKRFGSSDSTIADAGFETSSMSDPLLDFMPLDECADLDQNIRLFLDIDYTGISQLSVHFDHWNAGTPAKFFDAVESTISGDVKIHAESLSVVIEEFSGTSNSNLEWDLNSDLRKRGRPRKFSSVDGILPTVVDNNSTL